MNTAKYRPSNGTEGFGFICSWCERCARDADESCQILADTFAYSVDDPEYPKEWCFDDAGLPQCTAFIPEGEPVPAPRCRHTLDMFAATGPNDGDARLRSMIEHGMSGIDWSKTR